MANEKRLIDANELISNLRTFNGLGAVVAETLVRFTEKQPTVDAVEVIHGKWVMDDYTHRYRCSVCKAYKPYDTVGDYIDYWDCDYCPNCGAKMSG